MLHGESTGGSSDGSRPVATSAPRSEQLSEHFMALSRRIGAVAGGVSAAIGIAVLLGWLLDVELLKSISPTFVAMKANTALCLLLAGLSVILLSHPNPSRPRRQVSAVFAAVVFLTGAATLSEYLVGWNLGIDEALFDEAAGTIGTSAPGRMALTSTLCFMALGVSLLLLRSRKPQRAQPPALVVALLGIMSLSGYVYGVSAFQGVISWTPLALHTAVAFFVLGLGICLISPAHGVMRVLSSDGSGAVIARRLLPFVMVLPPALGFLRVQGTEHGLFPAPFGISLKDTTIAVVLTSVIWASAKRMNRADTERRMMATDRALAFEQLRAAHEALETVNADLGRAKEEAERANRAKSEFLSRMSHELRTPLNAILGFAQLLKMDGLSNEQKENATEIERGGRHLLQLTNEVLDITRIETGRLGISIEPVCVSQVLDESISLVRPLAAQRGIELRRTDLIDADQYVSGDRQRLRQVVLNILSNAVKYNREGGAVDVTCEVGPSGRVRIEISDSGYGIPADKIDVLFEPFERLGAESTEVEGTGLGLAVSKALVTAMNGTISVDSQVGQGTTFTVELPVTESPLAGLEEESHEPPSREGAHFGRRTVLYVEDNVPNLKLMERVLARRPEFELVTETNGQAGLQAAREVKPDILLLDLNLPDLSGEEILRALRNDEATAHIPIVVVSADATKSQIERLRALGAFDYVTKPIDLERLFDVLDRVAGARVAS